jgi:hypothetical protein
VLLAAATASNTPPLPTPPLLEIFRLITVLFNNTTPTTNEPGILANVNG